MLIRKFKILWIELIDTLLSSCEAFLTHWEYSITTSDHEREDSVCLLVEIEQFCWRDGDILIEDCWCDTC